MIVRLTKIPSIASVSLANIVLFKCHASKYTSNSYSLLNMVKSCGPTLLLSIFCRLWSKPVEAGFCLINQWIFLYWRARIGRYDEYRYFGGVLPQERSSFVMTACTVSFVPPGSHFLMGLRRTKRYGRKKQAECAVTMTLGRCTSVIARAPPLYYYGGAYDKSR